MGRAWQSPNGNLFVSLLLNDPCERCFMPQLAHVAAVALISAIRAVGGPLPGLALKWPNDVLIGRAKTAGILVEGTVGPSGDPACVIGWGINCAWHPEGLPYAATHLSAAAGRPISAEQVSDALRPAMARALDSWDHGRKFEAIRQAWLEAGPRRGTRLAVTAGREIVEGFFEGMDFCGRLQLQCSAGVRTFEAGEVVLQDPSAATVS